MKNLGNFGIVFQAAHEQFEKGVNKVTKGLKAVEKQVEETSKKGRVLQYLGLTLQWLTFRGVQELSQRIERLRHEFTGIAEKGREAFFEVEEGLFYLRATWQKSFGEMEAVRKQLRFDWLIENNRELISTLEEMRDASVGVIDIFAVQNRTIRNLVYGLKEFYGINVETAVQFIETGKRFGWSMSQIYKVLGKIMASISKFRVSPEILSKLMELIMSIRWLDFETGRLVHRQEAYARSLVASSVAMVRFLGDIDKGVEAVSELQEATAELYQTFRRYIVGLEDWSEKFDQLVEVFVFSGRSIGEIFEFMTAPAEEQIKTITELIARYRGLGWIGLREIEVLKMLFPKMAAFVEILWRIPEAQMEWNEYLQQGIKVEDAATRIVASYQKQLWGSAFALERRLGIWEDEVEMMKFQSLMLKEWRKGIERMIEVQQRYYNQLKKIGESTGLLAGLMKKLVTFFQMFKEYGLRGLLSHLGPFGVHLANILEIGRDLLEGVIIPLWVFGGLGRGMAVGIGRFLGRVFKRTAEATAGEAIGTAIGTGLSTAIGTTVGKTVGRAVAQAVAQAAGAAAAQAAVQTIRAFGKTWAQAPSGLFVPKELAGAAVGAAGVGAGAGRVLGLLPKLLPAGGVLGTLANLGLWGFIVYGGIMIGKELGKMVSDFIDMAKSGAKLVDYLKRTGIGAVNAFLSTLTFGLVRIKTDSEKAAEAMNKLNKELIKVFRLEEAAATLDMSTEELVKFTEAVKALGATQRDLEKGISPLAARWKQLYGLWEQYLSEIGATSLLTADEILFGLTKTFDDVLDEVTKGGIELLDILTGERKVSEDLLREVFKKTAEYYEKKGKLVWSILKETGKKTDEAVDSLKGFETVLNKVGKTAKKVSEDVEKQFLGYQKYAEWQKRALRDELEKIELKMPEIQLEIPKTLKVLGEKEVKSRSEIPKKEKVYQKVIVKESAHLDLKDELNKLNLQIGDLYRMIDDRLKDPLVNIQFDSREFVRILDIKKGREYRSRIGV